MFRTRFITPIAFAAMLLPTAVLALTGMPGSLTPQPARCETQTLRASLPALHIEVCTECEVSRDDITVLRRAYAESAQAMGHTIDFLSSAHVGITETGVLPNGAPYVIGETAGMRFRVGDPDPGATLGTALGRMTFVILSGVWQNVQEEGLK